MKAIFENNTDYSQFTGYTGLPVVSTVTQPLAFGGSVLTVTSTTQKYVKFVPDFSTEYLSADIDASGFFNATDNGLSKISITNFISAQY
jgi:hypothetical protein